MLAADEAMLFWRYIESSLDRLVGCLADLSEAQLNWRPPAPGTNSLYVLAVHTLGNAEENLLQTLAGWSVGRDRDGEFAAVGDSARALAARWHGSRAELRAHLAGLPADALDTTYDHPRRGSLTGREILIVVARHAAEHLGQAELMHALLRVARLD
jgi:uncharacterized damage-inducible protein DinB